MVCMPWREHTEDVTQEDVHAGRKFGEESLAYVSYTRHVIGGGRGEGTPPDKGVKVFGKDGFREVAEVFFQQDGGYMRIAKRVEGDDVTFRHRSKPEGYTKGQRT